MAIRDWSARRLLAVWALGVAVEAGLLGALVLQAPRIDAALFRVWAQSAGPTPAARTPAPREPDSLVTARAESRGVVGQTQDDTVTGVQLSPALEPTESALARRVARARFAVLAMLASIFLPIPIALLAVTGIWLVGRRRRVVGRPAPAS